jgi:hypothetical protein
MFRGAVVWRGIVYASLMAVGKLFCGLWVLRFDINYRCGIWRRDKNGKLEKEKRTKTVPTYTAVKAEQNQSSVPRPKSLYPAFILGSAMIARGEIGFLVSAIAQSNGIFDRAHHDPASDGSSQDLFLIVTWAIVLCTVIGPVGVGSIVRRVRRLQIQRNDVAGNSGQADPLGIWGLDTGPQCHS